MPIYSYTPKHVLLTDKEKGMMDEMKANAREAWGDAQAAAVMDSAIFSAGIYHMYDLYKERGVVA